MRKRLALIVAALALLAGIAAAAGAEENGPWAGKKWVAVGDSHTEINFRATKNYVTYIQEATGITAVNLGKSGAGWKRKGGFYSMMYKVPPDADVVTFYGSFNDLDSGFRIGTKTDTGTATVAGCVNTALDSLYARCPGITVGIITPCPWEQYTPLTGLVPEKGRPEDRSEEAIAYCQLLIDICEMRGIPCLDLFRTSGLRPWEAEFRKEAYTRDGGRGCHPDENGHRIIAPQIQEFIGTLLGE